VVPRTRSAPANAGETPAPGSQMPVGGRPQELHDQGGGDDSPRTLKEEAWVAATSRVSNGDTTGAERPVSLPLVPRHSRASHSDAPRPDQSIGALGGSRLLRSGLLPVASPATDYLPAEDIRRRVGSSSIRSCSTAERDRTHLETPTWARSLDRSTGYRRVRASSISPAGVPPRVPVGRLHDRMAPPQATNVVGQWTTVPSRPARRRALAAVEGGRLVGYIIGDAIPPLLRRRLPATRSSPPTSSRHLFDSSPPADVCSRSAYRSPEARAGASSSHTTPAPLSLSLLASARRRRSSLRLASPGRPSDRAIELYERYPSPAPTGLRFGDTWVNIHRPSEVTATARPQLPPRPHARGPRAFRLERYVDGRERARGPRHPAACESSPPSSSIRRHAKAHIWAVGAQALARRAWLSVASD
jgi:hypothetical protein